MFRAVARFTRITTPLVVRSSVVSPRCVSLGARFYSDKKDVADFAQLIKDSPEVMSKLVELRRFMSEKGFDTLEFNKITLMKMMSDSEIRGKLQEVAGELEKSGLDPTQFDFKELYKKLQG